MIDYILTDITGTTTARTFVRETLTRYALALLPSFLQTHRADPEVQGTLSQIVATLQAEGVSADTPTRQLAALHTWIQQDRKHTALKSLLGSIWAGGYARGELVAHVYPDVPAALQRWRQQGRQVGVYSSGAAAAQQQLFQHTAAGDLRDWFSHYFDTRYGHKLEVVSYHKVLQVLGISAQRVLFLSDVPGELHAATQAGMHVRQLVRPGTAPASQYPRASSFDEIFPSTFCYPSEFNK